ncbi:MAG: hypothetical protein PW789_00250 [Edaphobacter sp.]|uniref:hypothetical protein n=1 Tax=Edaphobacter sp. TaxID=1934404 RepID=UPI00238C70FA|nr:hypothetical protein [Edaphobacter sp.]MDE1175022.1 hypothetical protein [Edaphobacter sp.]
MATAPAPPSAEARRIVSDWRWLLARRIARSRTFARSEQLPRLLLHVCKMKLAGRDQELSEQQIGVAIFRRAPGYDPGVDGIVRSHATRLRHKLDAYFSEEGAEEQERLEIPRGGYTPHFYRKEMAAVPVQVSVLEEPEVVLPEPAKQRRSRLAKEFRADRMLYVIAFFLLIQAAFLIVAWRYVRAKRERPTVVQTLANRSPTVARFWSTLFTPERRTIVVTGDSGLVMYETLVSNDVTLTEYLSGEYRDPAHSSAPRTSQVSREFLISLANRPYTSTADAQLAAGFAHLPECNQPNCEIISARNLRPSDAENSNLILLGSRQANPWIAMVEPQLKLVLKKREAPLRGSNSTYGFENRNPQPGEAELYTARKGEGNLGGSETYGQVAYLPNPSGKGKILVLDGIWNSGTLSAGKFVLENEAFAKWLASIEHPDGKIPSFELLLESRDIQNNPARTRIVSSRTITP